MRSTLAPAGELRFADHVRACRIGEQVILLDLKRDKYQGVNATRSASLADHIVDWPVGESSRPPSTPSGQDTAVSPVLRTLVSQAMLVKAGDSPPSRLHPDEPLESWQPSDTENRSAVTLQDMLRMARSAAGAALWLQWKSLSQIECHVTRLRRPRRVSSGPDELHRQVSKYMRMRPIVFSARDRCLHDSLSLIRFLGAQGLFPQWIIGVRTRPFAAHSWVQSGNLVLNDLHEHVRAFRPILVV